MNKKGFSSLLLLILLSFGLASCNPKTPSENSEDGDRTTYSVDAYGNYYNNCLSWTNGEDLKSKLSTAINTGFVAKKYDGVWNVNQAGDQAFDNLDMIDQLYSEDDILKTRTKGSGDQLGWDREHVMPKTLIVGSNPSTSSPGPLTDFHNLFAAWTTGNNSRGNKNLGNVETPTGTIGDNKYTDTVFEPSNSDDKGKTSRAIFYMATMYSDLYLREEVCGTGDKCHGNLSNMLEWNLNPVTREEYQHNTAVLAYQFNRNPYIDYPELADYVFGSKQNESGELKYIEPTILKLEIASAEVNNHAVKDGVYEFLVGKTFSKSTSLKVVEVNKNFTVGKTLSTDKFTVSGVEDNETFSTIGTKEVSVYINSSHQTITYPINITVDPVAQMSWNHTFTKDNFSGASGVTNSTTLSGVEWTELRANASATYTAIDKTRGIQVGSSAASIGTLTLTSADEFSFASKNSIKEIAFEGSVAANTTATIAFKVDGVLIEQMTVEPNTSGFNTYIATLDTALSGVVTIEISGIQKALYCYRIGIEVQ